MVEKLLSKTYLQSIPEKLKHDFINRVIDSHLKNIEETAAKGNTSYTINISTIHPLTLPSAITFVEYYIEISRRFPECEIYNTKDGIKIDWS